MADTRFLCVWGGDDGELGESFTLHENLKPVTITLAITYLLEPLKTSVQCNRVPLQEALRIMSIHDICSYVMNSVFSPKIIEITHPFLSPLYLHSCITK